MKSLSSALPQISRRSRLIAGPAPAATRLSLRHHSPARGTVGRAWAFGLAAVLVAVGPAVAAPAAADRPLPVDPHVFSGRLANGVHWMYRHHNNPPGKMSVYMHVKTGSLNETDAQRGIAHFIEHLVFNGTENFPPGTLVPYFESIGMQFGKDLNANTSFERTAYTLTLPEASPEEVDRALKVLSDYAFRASLIDEEIDKERGVILEEMRSRKSASQRLRDELLPQLYPGSRFAQRLPIGTEDVITHVPPSEIEAYYRTWYRPENVTVILVGDADSKPLLPLVEKWFGQYKAPVPPSTPAGAEIKPFTEQRAIVLSDPEITTAQVQFVNILPGRPPTTTVAQWRAERVENIGVWLQARRFDALVKEGRVKFRGAATGVSGLMHEVTQVTATANGEPADWNTMLDELIREIHRAREYGFSEDELDLVRKQAVATAERAVRTEPTRSASSVIQEMFNSANDGEPVLSARQELDLLNELLPTITAAEVSRVYADRFAPGPYAYVLVLPDKEGVTKPSSDDLLAAAKAAWARKVEAPTTQAAAKDLLTALPKPGRIVDTHTDKELGITQARLSNGIPVHYRFMDYKKDSVLVRIALAGGAIEEKPDEIGVTSAAAIVLASPATSRLTSTAIRDLKIGKNIGVSGGPGDDDDVFSIGVGGSPKDLEFGLQLAYALMTDGKIESAVFDLWKQQTLRSIERNQSSVTYKAGEALGDMLSGGDPRRMPVKAEAIERISISQAQAWFERLCRTAPIEVTVVGDVPWDQVRPLIERYIGSLPARTRKTTDLDKLRTLARGAGPLARRIEVETVTPTAVAYAGFVSCDGQQRDDRRALTLAANILTSRLIKHVREDLSIVYSIGAANSSPWVYRDSGMFRAGAKCRPENADLVIEEVHNAFADFARNGPTAEEIDNARKQTLNQLDVLLREPSFWLSLLSDFDLRGRTLDECRDIPGKYSSITAEQVRAAFAKYYVPDRKFAIGAIPVPPHATSQPATADGQTAPTKEPDDEPAAQPVGAATP